MRKKHVQGQRFSRRGKQKLKDENTYANHRKLMQKQQGHFRID